MIRKEIEDREGEWSRGGAGAGGRRESKVTLVVSFRALYGSFVAGSLERHSLY